MHTKIEKSTLNFLRDLSQNNNREWFTAYKDRYQNAYENMIRFADDLLAEMQKHDFLETRSGKQSLMRIYRDIRFSKDKTPYRDHFGGGFRRATRRLRGGYYYEIGIEKAIVVGGFFSPNKSDLLRIRQDMDVNYPEWQEVLYQDSLFKTFGPLKGKKLSTAPRGFAKDHPAIDLLRYKQFYLEKSFSQKEILSDEFVYIMNDGFRALRPYFDFMSYILTTDANGVSLLD